MFFGTILIALLFFVLGSVIGSFLNVVIHRLDWKSGLSGRSHCPSCKHVLQAVDLVPIFSYLYLAGKCRYCDQPISVQYPLVELATGLVFFSTYITLSQSFTNEILAAGSIHFWIQLLYLLFFFSVLIVLTIFDLKKGILPDKILFPAILLSLIHLLFSSLTRSSDLFEVLRLSVVDLTTAFGIAVFFLALIVFTKGKGMGGGDFKLSIFIGLSLGWPLAIVGVMLGFLTGAISAVMLILVGKKGFGQTIPFGPFLALGAYLSALFGENLFGLYLKTLGL